MKLNQNHLLPFHAFKGILFSNHSILLPKVLSLEVHQFTEIIEKHPQGIKLIKIADELDVYFLTLTGTIKDLLEDERIEKDDLLYRIKDKGLELPLEDEERTLQEGETNGCKGDQGDF